MPSTTGTHHTPRIVLCGIGAWVLTAAFGLAAATARAEESRSVLQAVQSAEESAAASLARGASVAKSGPKHQVVQRGNPRRPAIMGAPDVDPNAPVQPTTVAKAGPLAGGTFFSFPGPSAIIPLPPDPILAVGEDHVVVVTNAELAVYTRTGNRVFRDTWENFFAEVDENGDIDAIFDPKVLYDFSRGRFFIVIIGAQGTPNIQSSSYLIATTRTGDPTGVWLKFNSDSSVNNNWSDYPGLGVDNHAIYVTANYFTSQGNYVASNVRVYEKDQFFSTPRPIQLAFSDNIAVREADEGAADLAFTIQPAVSYTPQELGWMVSGRVFVTGETEIIAYHIDADAAPRSIRRFTVDLPAGHTYTTPDLVTQPGGIPVDALDGRFLNAVVVGNSLWAVHTSIGTGNFENVVRWYEIDITSTINPQIKQTGIIGVPNGSCFNGAIAANSAGEAVVTYTRTTRTGEHLAMYFSCRDAGSAPGAMPTTQLVQRGGTTAYQLFRWGDYAGAALDPLDNASIWIINETAPNTIQWSTTVARIPLTGAGGGPGQPTCPNTLDLGLPDGGEFWVAGTLQDITWSGAESDPDSVLVNLALARFNPDSQQSEVIGLIENDANEVDFPGSAGRFTWEVGENIRPLNGADGAVPPSGEFADYQVVVQSVFCPEILAASTTFFRVVSPLGVSIVTDPAPAEAPDPGEEPIVLISRGESVELTAVVTGGIPPYQFRWTPVESLSAPTAFQTDATPIVGTVRPCEAGLECIRYTIQVRDATGPVGQVANATALVRVADDIRVDAGPDKQFAAGGSVVLEGSAVGGGKPYTYLWEKLPNDAEGEIEFVSSEPQPTIQPTEGGIYRLTVTDRLGDSSFDTMTVARGFVVTVTNTPSGAGTVARTPLQSLYAAGQAVQFTATPATGVSFVRFEFTPQGGELQINEGNPAQFQMPAGDLTVVAVYNTTGGGASRPNGGNGGLDLLSGMTCAQGAAQAMAVAMAGFWLLGRRTGRRR